MKEINSFRYLLFLFILFTFISGCKKEEGPGGTSTIKGKVIVNDFDGGYQNPAPSAIYPAADEKVYVIYGLDNTTYSDDFNTSYDGTYEFKYLQKGQYRIFAYSKDSTGASNFMISGLKIPVFVDVEITSDGSTVEAPPITILDNNF